MVKRANVLYITVSGLLFLNFILLFFILDSQRGLTKVDESSFFLVSDHAETVGNVPNEELEKETNINKREQTGEVQKQQNGVQLDELVAKSLEPDDNGKKPERTEAQDKGDDRSWKLKARNTSGKNQDTFFENLHQQFSDQLVSVELFTKTLEKEIVKRKTSSSSTSFPRSPSFSALSTSISGLITQVQQTARESELLREKIEVLKNMLLSLSGNGTREVQSTLSSNTSVQLTSLPTGAQIHLVTQLAPFNNNNVGIPPVSTTGDLESLSYYVQEVLRKKQSITEEQCKTERLLLCGLTNACGFACALHQITFCAVIAYAKNRTLVIFDDEGWRYATGCNATTEGRSLDCFYEKASVCPNKGNYRLEAGTWNFENEAKNMRVLKVPFYSRAIMLKDEYHYKTYGWANTDGNNIKIPMYVPPEIKANLEKLHGESRGWFVGQLEKFFFKPNARIRAMLNALKDQMELDAFYFGIHVRRTDKLIREAQFHHLDEYMNKIEEHIASQGDNSLVVAKAKIENKKMQVFVATDDSHLESEMSKWKSKYDFKMVKFDKQKKGSDLSSPTERWNKNGAQAILADLHFLSHSQFLVGTFSSQVTRLAFEMQQAVSHKKNCKNCTKSLDHPWYFP